MKQNETNLVPKGSKIYTCETCDYKSSRYSQYERHLLTQKHKIYCFETNETNLVPKGSVNLLQHNCMCGISFNSKTTLWRHKKTCNKVNTENKEPTEDDKEKDVNKLVTYLMQENAEFKQLLIDQNKQIIELSKNAGNNNNNSFNLNFYLNETCKDALNIMDFVNQLQVGIKDLEETGRLGFADGISKIFINGLKQLDVSNRPVHCSDSKREILYIKNNNEWNKEDDERKVLTSAIKHVVNKNIKQIPEWTKVHPDYNDYDSKENDKFLKIVSEAMSGSSQEETNKNYNKIIKNIVKETVIEK
jgi:hypothetical protein